FQTCPLPISGLRAAPAARRRFWGSEEFLRVAENRSTDWPPTPVAAPPGCLAQGCRGASAPRVALRGGRHRQDAPRGRTGGLGQRPGDDDRQRALLCGGGAPA